MCDHCKTFKPLLEGKDRFGETVVPMIQQKAPNIPTRVNNAIEGGCCSWRRSCCDGGCCDQITDCCGNGSQNQASIPHQKPTAAYGQGLGCGQMPMGMTELSAERVPCVTSEKKAEKKLPMCFGGDCNDSIDGDSETN